MALLIISQIVLTGKFPQLGWVGVATMEPPDRGELDNFNIILALKLTGYIGLGLWW